MAKVRYANNVELWWRSGASHYINEELGKRNEELRATHSHLIVMCRVLSFYFLLSTF